MFFHDFLGGRTLATKEIRRTWTLHQPRIRRHEEIINGVATCCMQMARVDDPLLSIQTWNFKKNIFWGWIFTKNIFFWMDSKAEQIFGILFKYEKIPLWNIFQHSRRSTLKIHVCAHGYVCVCTHVKIYTSFSPAPTLSTCKFLHDFF